MTPRLIFRVVERKTAAGALETLSLKPGLNLLIGPSNSGKSRWLQMMDFLFGKERSAAIFLGDDIANKYVSVNAIVTINGIEHKLERQWSSALTSEHVFVDGKPLDSRRLSEFFLNALNIPVLHFPKSRLLGDYTWPELGWRVMLRHIYRQEKYWSDIADRQPPSEQHAALLQFLGLAEYVFSSDAQRHNEIRRELLQATARKQEFEQLISEIAEGILPDYQSGTGVTERLLDIVITKLQRETAMLVEDRSVALERAVAFQPTDSNTALNAADMELGKKRSELLSKIESVQRDYDLVTERISKLKHTHNVFSTELERLARARAAGDLFVDLKVTHCPVCDQKVEPAQNKNGVCYCCKQEYDYPKIGERLDFEASQLRDEFNETTLLLDTLSKQELNLRRTLDEVQDEMRTVESNLRPARSKVAGFLPPEVAILDAKRGKLDEKISNAHRLKGMLRSRRDLSVNIDKMTAELSVLEAKFNKNEDPVKWQESADKLADGINTYLSLVRPNSQPWNKGRATTKITERFFKIDIDGTDWNGKLGGNYRCIFLVAYHYSLLQLTNDSYCHYPGLTIIDFPPNPSDQLGSDNTLNYLLSPFFELLKKPDMQESQVIVAARELVSVEGANTILLKKQWL